MIDREVIEKIGPTFDRHDKFIFFYNYKVVSSSIQDVERGICKDRVIRQKQHNDEWYKKLGSYSDEDLEQIFKFTIVRNPWDRLVSAHKYFVHSVYNLVSVPNDFEQFVKQTLLNTDKESLLYPSYAMRVEAHVGFQYPRVQMVDCIAKMETLDNDFKFIREKSNIDGKLPHINKTNHSNYRKYYTDELKNIVGDFYKKDIEFLKYDF